MFFIHFFINILSSFQKTFSFIHQSFASSAALIPHRLCQLFFTFESVFVCLILVIEVAEYMRLQRHFSKLFLQNFIKLNLKLLSKLALCIAIIIVLQLIFLFPKLFSFPIGILAISELFDSLIHFYEHRQFVL
jgi:hypothetical protein